MVQNLSLIQESPFLIDPSIASFSSASFPCPSIYLPSKTPTTSSRSSYSLLSKSRTFINISIYASLTLTLFFIQQGSLAENSAASSCICYFVIYLKATTLSLIDSTSSKKKEKATNSLKLILLSSGSLVSGELILFRYV